MKTKEEEFAEERIYLMRKTMIALMPKRLFYQRKTTTVVEQKGYIDIDDDFTQVYSQFCKMVTHLKSLMSIKLLFWMLAHEANKSGGITSGKPILDKFNKFLISQKEKPTSLRTFHAAFEELVALEAVTRVGRGHYYFNPHVFWKDGKKEREKFIVDEEKDGDFKSKNLVDQKLIELPLSKKLKT